MFDATINVGTLIQIGVIITGGLWFMWRLETKILLIANELTGVVKNRESQDRSNTDKFDDIETQLKELIKITVELAKVETRMNNMDERMQEMSNRIVNRIKHQPTRKKG